MTVSKLKVQKAILVSQAKLKESNQDLNLGRHGNVRQTEPDDRNECEHNFIIGGEKAVQQVEH